MATTAPTQPKPAETLKAPARTKLLKVAAAYGQFIDLESDRTITKEPVEVEITPWLQAQIDAGKLTLC